MKKKGQDIHIIKITTIFGCQQVNLQIFPKFKRQPAAIVKLKLKFLSKILIEGPLILLLTEKETSTEHKLLV